MKRNFSFRFIMLALVAVLFTVTSCKDYDDDIKKIEAALEAYKAGAANDLKATKAELEKKITDLKGDVTTVAGKVKALEEKVASVEANAATKKELEDAKKELMAKLVSLETFNAYKKQVDAKLADLEAKLAKAATKDEVKALEDKLNAKIAQVETDLGKRIAALEGVLKLVNGESEVLKEINARLDGIDKSLEDHLAKINENKAAIEALKTELQEKYDELKGLIEANKTAIENLDAKVERYKKELDDKDKELEKMIGFNAANILTLSKQLEGLTFIPTRGLPSEKTMKLYYFAGDYTADHVLMYRVSPSNAKLGEDFTIESLNFQITTRSADDGVEDHSSKVDVHINGEVTQKGDIIYIPVHIENAEACKVFGNNTWWGNEFFHGDNVLRPNNFGPRIVITVDEKDPTPNVNYDAKGGNRGLSIVVTALTNDIKREEGQAPAKLRVKSTEHVHAELIPTQIKLAEVVGQNGLMELGKAGKPVLTARLLKRTLAEATAWANENENTLEPDNKNWNILMWSGTYNYTPNGDKPEVANPGWVDLNDYVTSYYYPQDGGNFKNEKVVPGDPFRHFYNEFGAFGEPYTDKPVYAKPVYEFLLVAYEDHNHNIITLDNPATHPYAEIVNGSILKIKDDQIDAAKTKKVIVKVTQVNSECDERQPVGYIVVKIVESSTGWGEANWTIDLTQNHDPAVTEDTSYANLPYYHKMFGTGAPVSGNITDFKDALGNNVPARWMNPLNNPGSYGISTATPNPGDINPILKQLRMIGAQHEFETGYVINGPNSKVTDKTFTAAQYNHVNDKENVDATGVDAEAAFSHVLIRFEKNNNSFIVYVDDKAPAGDYSITYRLEYKDGNVQYNRVLNLTFKFRVALRTITVKTDAPNWIDAEHKVLRGQYVRKTNSISTGGGEPYTFLNEHGYKLDLTQTFDLKSGTKTIITEELPADGNGNKAGDAPEYRPRFEFIYDQAIVDAGFDFERDAENYLTIIRHRESKTAAAQIRKEADDMYRLRLKEDFAGDYLYNYLTGNIKKHTALLPHNLQTKTPEDATLERQDDMEKILKVRMVTDINANSPAAPDKFANNNYYYIYDFGVKFERALRWKFTEVVLKDEQLEQKATFNFFTRVPGSTWDQGTYRGLFDHGYASQDNAGIGLLVSMVEPTTAQTPDKAVDLAAWYGLKAQPSFPLDTTGLAVDYNYIEISLDGNTWKVIDEDYKTKTVHNPRYFHIKKTGNEWEVTWQGDGNALKKPLYFRVPVINQTAIDNGIVKGAANNVVTEDLAGGNFWMTFRHEKAKVRGYAVFKIQPRPGA